MLMYTMALGIAAYFLVAIPLKRFNRQTAHYLLFPALLLNMQCLQGRYRTLPALEDKVREQEGDGLET
jgi:hypothetical protein